MNDLPLLPGHRFKDVTGTNFLVPRTLSFKHGYRVIRLPRFGIGQTYKSHVQLKEDERQRLVNFQPELIYGKVRVKEPKQFVPARLLYDKKILRFNGYFKQTIYESPLEYYRVRRVIIYYYLEDDTMSIYEIPYENSALVQGLRLRRHRIPKNNQNEPYNWRDLNLGQNITIYGTVYRLCDCDQFTKEWLESEGIILQYSESIPSDPYRMKLKKKNDIEKQRIGRSNLKDVLPDLLATTSIKNNIDHKRCSNMDNKVLRFYATLDNQGHQCVISRKFIIHFYLADHTIEIREIHQINDGYDSKAIYLHRQTVPKDSTYHIKSFVNLFINKREQEKICYMKPEDFILGHTITIFNHVFFLYDCDAFTKDFYHQNFAHLNCSPTDMKRDMKPCIQLPSISPDIMFDKRENSVCDENRSN